MTNAERLKAIRRELGLTQKEFAELTGISISLLRYMETEKREISPKTLKKILATFPTLNMDYLKYGEGKILKQGSEVSSIPIIIKLNEKKLAEVIQRTLRDSLDMPMQTVYDVGFTGVFYDFRVYMQEIQGKGYGDNAFIAYQLWIARERDKAKGILEAIQIIQNTMLEILNDKEEN